MNKEKKDKFIPVCSPTLLGNEQKYVLDAVKTGWISSSGKYISKFEEAFSRYCGVKHGVAVCNGTTALHLAIVALGIGKKDEVIIPNFTMISSAFSVCYAGAKPVFVDAGPKTWNINPTKIEEKINKRTKAIMAVHIYGNPCEMNMINNIAKKYGLKVIEDAAEAHGAEYYEKKCGALSDISCFSFYANKNITTGEGGMVLTNDEVLAKRCRYHKNLCFPLDGSRNYLHNFIGFNYRMSNIHAALGLAQTELAEKYVGMRRKNNLLYRKYLEGVSGIVFQEEKENSKNVFWMNGVVIEPEKFGISRDRLMQYLLSKGIETRKFFEGMHKQLSLKKYGCDVSGKYPVSDWLSENGLYLPSGSGLTEKEISDVCKAIKEAGQK